MTTAAFPGLVLRDYQRECLDALAEAQRQGKQRVLVALPTGTGKTVIFSHDIRDRQPARSLILVHRDELVQQARDKLHAVDPTLHVGIVKAELDQVDAQVVLASVQTVSRPNRLQRLAKDFNLLVIDEAHHGAAASYRTVLEYLGAFESNGPFTVGYTATPERGDNVSLGGVFEGIVFQKSILEMIESGYLSDLRAKQVRLHADFGALHTRGGDFIESELEQTLLNADAPQHAVEAYMQHAKNRKALLFTPTVKTAKAMARAFVDAGIAAESLDASTPIDDRHAMLARLRHGTTMLIANCAVLTEGFDEPSVDCIVVARPTKSKTLYIQMIGRGTRIFPGKDDCLILDLVGATTRHDLITANVLFGLEPKELESKTVTEALAARKRALQKQVPNGKLVVSEVELFARRHRRWLSASDAWMLPLAEQGYVALVPDGGETWGVVHVPKYPESSRTLYRGMPLDWAMGAAEDMLRRSPAYRLADPHADWRARPISDSQRRVLEKRHIAIPPNMTSGEASDAISVNAARLDRRNGRLAVRR